MSPEPESVAELIHACLSELREDLNMKPLKNIGPETAIYGKGSDLDSMGMVHLISDIEGRLFEKYGASWILADERALSRNRSPFKTVGDLTQFILEIQPTI